MSVTATRVDPDTLPHPPLGVFALVGRTAALVAAAALPLIGLSVLLAALRALATLWLTRTLANQGIDLMLQRTLEDGTPPNAISIAASALVALVSIVVFAVIHLVLLEVALRRDAGEPVRGAGILRTALRYWLPMSGAYVAVWFLIVLGLMGLVVPGIWLMGVYAVVSVVIVAEDRRLGFMRRTRHLTKGYRWPLVGFTALTYLAVGLVVLLAFGVGWLIPRFVDPASTAATVLTTAFGALTDGVTAAIAAASVVVAYRRLRAVKDGGDALKAVFA